MLLVVAPRIGVSELGTFCFGSRTCIHTYITSKRTKLPCKPTARLLWDNSAASCTSAALSQVTLDPVSWNAHNLMQEGNNRCLRTSATHVLYIHVSSCSSPAIYRSRHVQHMDTWWLTHVNMLGCRPGSWRVCPKLPISDTLPNG